MAAKDAAVGVHLVQDDVAQPLEKGRPAGVVGQDAGVQHVGVADQDLGRLADAGPLILGRVAVVGVRLDAHGPSAALRPSSSASWSWASALVGNRYSARADRVGQQAVEHRQVVAQRLAAGRRRDDDDVLAAQRRLDRQRLVVVGRLDAPPAERLDQPRIDPGRPLGIARQAGPAGAASG